MTSRYWILPFSLGFQTAFPTATLQGSAHCDHFDVVDAKGNIRNPADYRDHYQALGGYTLLDPKGNEMHYTYASAGTAEFYRQNKRFADGSRQSVTNTRRIGKRSMVLNGAMPRIEVDPETYGVRANCRLLTCEPACVLPMAQRCFLY
jgi:urease alpha subunit